MLAPQPPDFDGVGYVHAVLDAPLPTRVRRVLLQLGSLADDAGLVYGPGTSQRRLSLDCGYAPEATVRRALRDAEAAGWVERFEDTGRRSNSYRLLIPATSLSAGEVPPATSPAGGEVR